MHPYLKYYFSAKTKYQVHSPFVFEFLSDIFEDDRFYHFMGFIENYRRNLLGTNDKLTVKEKIQTVNQLTKSLSITPKIGEILFKTVHKYKPETLLELGNSLGIAALYQATPSTKANLTTLASDKILGDTTQKYFQRLGTQNIQLLSGDINKTLTKALGQFPSIEQVFFNGFWGNTATLSYFEHCLTKMPPNGVFIFRSPYATKATQEFWASIKQHQSVRLSIDIYDLGFLFFRSEQKEVAHHQIIESWKKPWAIY